MSEKTYVKMPDTVDYKGHTYYKNAWSEGYSRLDTNKPVWKYFFGPDDDRMFLWVYEDGSVEEDLFDYDFEGKKGKMRISEIEQEEKEPHFRKAIHDAFGFQMSEIKILHTDGETGKIEVCGILYEIDLSGQSKNIDIMRR